MRIHAKKKVVKISASDGYIIPAVVVSTNFKWCPIHITSNEGSYVPYIAVLKVALELWVHPAKKSICQAE